LRAGVPLAAGKSRTVRVSKSLRGVEPRSKSPNYSYSRASDEKQPEGDDSYDIAWISGF
jgi:hypothetical protein